MIRSPKSELAERVNKAIWHIKKGLTTEEIARRLMDEYGVSKRQAYRYIQPAQAAKGQLSIPESKEVFTVKLPISLIRRIRKYAKETDSPLGGIVIQALENFLKRRGHG